MKPYLTDCTRVIVEEITTHRLTQPQIAQTYALAMRSYRAGVDRPDWGEINRAILARWKPSSLGRIKAMAWKWMSARPGGG